MFDLEFCWFIKHWYYSVVIEVNVFIVFCSQFVWLCPVFECMLFFFCSNCTLIIVIGVRGGNNKSSLKKFKYVLFNPGCDFELRVCMWTKTRRICTLLYYFILYGRKQAYMHAYIWNALCHGSWSRTVHLLQLCENAENKSIESHFFLHIVAFSFVEFLFFYRQKSHLYNMLNAHRPHTK